MSTDDQLFDERITSYPWLRGVVVGVVTFLAGYALMAAVVVSTGSFASGASTGLKAKAIGFVYYNAQQVPIVTDSPVPVAGTIPSNLIAAGSTSLPTVVYYAVPVAVLLGGGAALAWWTLDAQRASVSEYVLPGIALTAGYLVTAVVVRYMIAVRTSLEGGDVVVQSPSLALTAVAGLAYPLIAASAGALAVGVALRVAPREPGRPDQA